MKCKVKKCKSKTFLNHLFSPLHMCVKLMGFLLCENNTEGEMRSKLELKNVPFYRFGTF